MTLTTPEARKQMFDRIDSVWSTQAAAIAGALPEMRYQGVKEAAKPGADKYWARASTQHVLTRQSAFTNQEQGEGGSKVIYETSGVLYIQIFAPMSDLTGWARGELLAQLGKGMFMAWETSGSVWFRNPRFEELEDDGTWYRWNVKVDFQYSEAKE